ncbi:hypothetical protein FJZ48_01150 [Candidatus Uhrbacteria bacterium]|nr:hypothetical protein [Candidatus Uhrbacteria bacterium]
MIHVTIKGFEGPGVPAMAADIRSCVVGDEFDIDDENLYVEISRDYVDGSAVLCFVTHFPRVEGDPTLSDRALCQHLAQALGEELEEKRKVHHQPIERSWVEVYVFPTPVGPRGYYSSKP